MTDRNRNQDQQNPDQQQRAPGADREDLNQSTERHRDQQSVADDRPLRGGREDVDLGAEVENEPGIDEGDGDEEIGGRDRSDR